MIGEDILALSATGQAALIRQGEISSAELVQTHLGRIERLNPLINAVIEPLTVSALESARDADSAIRRGEIRGPLHGVPFSVKDSIEIAGEICTAGTLGRRSPPPSSRDATVVKRLRSAGGIPLARTNLPDLLFAFESDNLLFGATKNPYDLSRTSGGSSGGEAALIASCGSPAGLGSDAAGSVRLPAAFCGITAIKPTSGRLPRTGHFPPAGGWVTDLWQIGPMARRVEDLCTMMTLLAGPDGRDPTVAGMPLRDPATIDLRPLRIAWYTDNGFAPPCPEVASVVESAARSLTCETASVENARPVCLAAAYDLEMKMIGADGGKALWDYLASVGSAEIHPLLRGWLDKLRPYQTDLAGFQTYWAELDRYRAVMYRFLREFDVIICPAYTQAALLHGTSVVDENFRGFSHTMAYNVAGWPAAVVRCGEVRCGETAAGLPIAVQIAAGPWKEDVVLAVALRLEEKFGGWKAPPILPASTKA
jgi:amidase